MLALSSSQFDPKTTDELGDFFPAGALGAVPRKYTGNPQVSPKLRQIKFTRLLSG